MMMVMMMMMILNVLTLSTRYCPRKVSLKENMPCISKLRNDFKQGQAFNPGIETTVRPLEN